MAKTVTMPSINGNDEIIGSNGADFVGGGAGNDSFLGLRSGNAPVPKNALRLCALAPLR